jgi:hypothetical protein
MALGSYDSYAAYYSQLLIDQTPPKPAFMREFYRVLYAYYATNGLYDYLNDQLRATKTSGQTLKPIRNPAWRVVEFYASKLFPGKLPESLPIESENQTIIAPIQQIWKWSNFSSLKQRMSRWFSIYGDLFLKVNTKGDPVDAVYLTLIRPENVTEMKVDERGFLTYIRIDVPGVDLEVEDAVHTEIWDKESQTVSVWEHELGMDVELGKLGTPTTSSTFEQAHGFDFIPIVYQPFRDDGSGRGSGAYSAQLDKIDEANRQATRLAQILFRYNKAIWAATNSGTDSSGRPMPPVSFEGLLNSDSELDLGDDDILTLPGMSSLQPLVPQINYKSALEVLEGQVSEIEKDLPELQYYEMRSSLTEVSGRAVRFLLDDMISRVREARGNAETALERSHAMALSIGLKFNVFLQKPTGTFEEGSFAHSFIERPILPEDTKEIAELIGLFVAAGASLEQASIQAGFTAERAKEFAQQDLFEAAIPGGR